MLDSTDYVMAWSIYLLAASALLLTGWRMTRRWWGWVKDPLRVAAAVVLLTPASVDGDPQHLAPAVFIVFFESVSAPDGGMGPLLGVRLLLIVMFAVIAVWVLRLLWYWLIAGRGMRTAEPPSVRR